MSMNASYRRFSPRLFHALQRDPGFVRAVIDFDPVTGHAPQLPPRIRQMLAQLPDEMREYVAGSVLVDIQKSGLGDTFSQLAADAAKRFSDSGLDSSDVGEILDIEKAWHGLHFLLTGTQWQPTDPPGNVVMGGKEIGDDLGYGPARFLNPNETSAAAMALEQVSEQELEASFNAEAFKAADIYAGHWDDPEELQWIMDAFRRVKSYFSEAARLSHGMLMFVT